MHYQDTTQSDAVDPRVQDYNYEPQMAMEPSDGHWHPNSQAEQGDHGSATGGFRGFISQTVSRVMHGQSGQSMESYEGLERKAIRYRAERNGAESKVKELQHQLVQFTRQSESLRLSVSSLRSQNDTFRTQIFAMGTGGGPVQNEEFYSSRFENLKFSVEKKLRSLLKDDGKYTLPETSHASVLRRISRVGILGIECKNFLTSGKYTIQALHLNVKWRQLLLRHIVALFLYVRVLEPFAFGLAQDVSTALKCVDKSVLSQGCSSKYNTKSRTTILQCVDDSPSERSCGWTVLDKNRQSVSERDQDRAF